MKEIKYLNGLRSIAVITVILYHFNYLILKGGFLGVDIFFIISGFLISSKLIYKLDNNDFSLFDFYKQRFFRIYPSLIFMITVSLVYIMLFENYIFGLEKVTGIFSLLGLNNYFQIFTNVDYFEKSIFPMPFIHMWSLAIEIQFYIFFPIIISKMYKLNLKKSINKLMIFFILFSFACMIYIFNSVSVTWAYYGTLSRVFSLFIGAFVGMNYKPIVKKLRKKIKRFFINLVTYILFIFMMIFLFLADGSSAFMYDAGFLLFSLLMGSLVIFLGAGNSFIKKLLSIDIFKFIAKRSYNYYLWHIPILILLPNLFPFIQLFLIILISEFVYKKIESKMIRRKFNFIKVNKFLISFIMIIIYIIPSNVFAIENKQDVKEVNSSENIYSIVSFYEDFLLDPSKLFEGADKNYKNYLKGNDLLSRQNIYVFGDSIIADIQYFVKENYPNAVVESKVGIQTNDLIKMMEPYAKYDSYNTVVIFDAGNNGLIRQEDLEKIKSMFEKSTIIVVNSAVNQYWSKSSNKNIDSYLADNKDAMKLVNWNGVQNKKELITGDEIHLTFKGVKEYSKMIEKAMYESLGIEYSK